MIGSTQTVVDRATSTLIFTRSFAAPPEAIFAAWTEPEQVSAWWDPTGARLQDCRIDLRVGGAFAFVHRESAHAPPFAGVYRVVNPPTELVFDALGALGTVKLVAQPGGTHMTVSIRCASPEHLEQFLTFGVKEGTEGTLDNLVGFIAAQGR